ncbi:MAG TPA: CvpA family protein [Bradyrhizobium sp.]|nr:CvpA family protein [Bradyrhizobium sp.]
MNPFDVVVFVVLISAAVSGFKAGLLRSAVTILAYLIALPTAVFLMSLASANAGGTQGSPLAQSSPMLFGVFLITGIVLAKFMRMALEDVIGPDAGIADRFAGAGLAIVRTGLVAITFVLSVDQLSSSGRQPGFLAGSQLRPLLSAAGQKGLNSLPPDVVAYLDRLKQARRI